MYVCSKANCPIKLPLIKQRIIMWFFQLLVPCFISMKFIKRKDNWNFTQNTLAEYFMFVYRPVYFGEVCKLAWGIYNFWFEMASSGWRLTFFSSKNWTFEGFTLGTFQGKLKFKVMNSFCNPGCLMTWLWYGQNTLDYLGQNCRNITVQVNTRPLLEIFYKSFYLPPLLPDVIWGIEPYVGEICLVR